MAGVLAVTLAAGGAAWLARSRSGAATLTTEAAGTPTSTASGSGSTSPSGSTTAVATPSPGGGSASGSSSGPKSVMPSRTATPRTTSSAGRSRSAGATGGVALDTRCTVSAVLVPSCGAYWGIYSRRYGNDVATTVRTWESRLGRQFDIVLMYYDFAGVAGNWPFPEPGMVSLGKDRILLLDWESKIYRTNTPLRWADIAAGKYDASEVVPQARRIKAYGGKVMLGLDHEMDLSYAEHGTPEEYVAAYRHIQAVFDRAGATNVVWTWVPTGDVGYGNGPLTKRFYPGNAYVDWVGFDPYNFASCQGQRWQSFARSLDIFYRWTAANGMAAKPLLVQEYGTVYNESDPAASTVWSRGIPAALASHPRVKALVRWDSDTHCILRIDNGPGMLESFKAAGLAVPRP